MTNVKNYAVIARLCKAGASRSNLINKRGLLHAITIPSALVRNDVEVKVVYNYLNKYHA